MKILVVTPENSPETMEISGNLDEMQRIVGGTIQTVYPFPEEVALICNDDGKLLGLPLNRGLRDADDDLYDIICGTFFLCGAPSDSDCFASLTDEQLEHFRKCFQTPEIFVKIGSRIVAFPMQD